jgi:hypothetical protein
MAFKPKRSVRIEPEVQPKLNFDVDVAKFTDRQMEAITALDGGKTKYLLYGGALGGGKSYFLRWVAIRLLMRWFSERGLKWVQVMLACEDYPSLKDRQLSKISREFPQWLGRMYSDHAEYGRCFILNEMYGNGVLCFRNLDDSSKYQSAEFAAILVDELTKNDLDTFTFLRTRLRWPGMRDIDCPFIGATNPGGLGHNFVKALWMDGAFPEEFIKPVDYRSTFAYIPSKAEDNPYLDASYYAQLDTLPPHLRSAFKDGSWDVFVGQAFQEWSRTYHVMQDMKIPDGMQIYMTFDWGFGAPFSIGWWWIDSDGRKYRFNEWYGWDGTPNHGLRLSDPEIAAGIAKREEAMGFKERGAPYFAGGSPAVNPQIIRIAGPDCFNKKPDYKGGGQGPSTAENFLNMGLMLRPGDPSRSLKYRQMHNHLMIPRDENKVVNGVPMLQVDAKCHHFIRTIPSLMIDAYNNEDIDTDGEDHCYDEACHIMMQRPVSAKGMEKKEVSKPPIDANEVMRLEREAIWKEVRDAEANEGGMYGF